jgi:hypothetical protein
MSARGSLATIATIVCAMCGCAAQAGEDDAADEAPAESLDLTVDSLDVVHGALRISATMVGGAADVSVRLGGECERRDVGGGMSTLSTLVWALPDADVADAIRCGLAVRARVREGARMVNKVAELGVNVDAISESQGADDGPQLQTAATSEAGIALVFAPVTRSARLTTGDSILEAAPRESEDEDPAIDGAASFVVPFLDFARSVLRGRPLVLEGSSFATSLSVQGVSLRSDPAPIELGSVEGDPQGPDEQEPPDDPP